MARQLCSCMLLLVVTAVSSSSLLSKRNRVKTTMVPAPLGPPVGVEIMRQASKDATAAEQMWFEDLEFHLHNPNKKTKRRRQAMEENDCSERVSCRNFLWPHAYHGDDIIHRNCLCDELCETFDDCCHDYVRHPNSSVYLRPEVTACQSLSFSKQNDYTGFQKYSVVVRCPADYSEPDIRKKCELDNSADADLFYRLPVNGRTSMVLYLNVYCAICNGEMDVVYWTGERDTCHIKPRDNYKHKIDDQQPSDNHDTATEQLIAKNSDCDTTFILSDGYFLRPCKPVRRQCGADWTNGDTARKCEERSELNSYVYRKSKGSSMAFRNKHCAICNRLTEAETSCVDPTQSPGTPGMPGLPGLPGMPGRVDTSFKILIDLNAKSLTISETSFWDKQTRGVVKLRECDPGYVYDPYAEICRLVSCRKAYRMTDAGCEHNPDFYGHDDTIKPRILFGAAPYDQTPARWTQTNFSCSPMIPLNKSEYTVLNNQSAYVYAMNSLFTEDQYALDPPFLYICPPFTRQYNVTLLVMFQFDNVQSIMSLIGVILSLVGLLIQFVIYMIFPELRNIPGKCIVCLVVSLFVGQLAFLFVEIDGLACFFLGAAMHFGFLAAFTWMNALAFDIFWTFTVTNMASLSSSGSKWKRFLAYSVYAWLTPLLIVGLCIMMDVLDVSENFRPHYSEGVCWITNQNALLMFFVVPVGVILIVNIVFFCTTLVCICRSAHVAQAATPKTDAKSLLLISIKLFFIMGLTWLFGFMASLTDWAFLWYAFIIFNSLQGAFLCLMFLCTVKVYRLIKTKYPSKSIKLKNLPQNNEKASTNESNVSKDNEVVVKETVI